MRALAASVLTALAVAAIMPASAPAAWVTPKRARAILRADASPHAAPRALAYRGEILRVTATRRARTGVWRRVALDGRSGWLARAHARLTPAPVRRRAACISRALGTFSAGRLLCGRLLHAQGTGFRTWDLPLSRKPSRPARRWGTSRLLARIAWIGRRWQARHPLGARLLVADLSRRHGGPFGRRFGGVGHVSHQNGLDVDILYPRRDNREREASRPSQVDRRRARELVAIIARSHPKVMFVGCRLGLPARGRAKHVCRNHENHVHVRYAP